MTWASPIKLTEDAYATAGGVELAWIRVSNTLQQFGNKSVVLALFFLSKNLRKVRWATLNSSNAGWQLQSSSALFDKGLGSSNPGDRAALYEPAITNWPDLSYQGGKTCSAVVGLNKEVFLYCLNPTTLQWEQINDFENSVRPKAETKPAIVFHRTRNSSDGSLHGHISAGQFFLVMKEKNLAANLQYFEGLTARLGYVDYQKPPTLFPNPPTAFSQYIFSSWYIPYGYTSNILRGMSLYEDKEISATKGLWVLDGKLSFIPMADGTYRTSFKGGNDFQAMANQMCQILHGTTGWPCQGCTNNSQCPQSIPYCSGNTCKECVYNIHCPGNQLCIGSVCQ